MFRRPVAELPHPHHEPEPDPDERLARIVAQIEAIGRRNDAMRSQIARRQHAIDTLLASAERDQADLEPPDSPRRLPEETVAELVATIISDMPAMPPTLGLELEAFAECRAVRDARRLADTLRHDYGREGLAREIEDALSPD
jgi:hypothetical protein